MIGTIRSLRRRLARMRYYAADRPRTAWARWRDASLLIALGLAVPATLFAEGAVRQAVVLETVSGSLAGVRGGAARAAAFDADEDRSWPPDSIAEWTVERPAEDGGWPLTSRRTTFPVRLDIRDFLQTKTATDVQLDPADPVRVAIENALANAARRDLLADWRSRTTPERRWFVVGALANIVLWWVMLTLVMIIALRIAEFASLLGRAARARRNDAFRTQNRCANCGYDLTGLDFRPHCPECGAFLE